MALFVQAKAAEEIVQLEDSVKLTYPAIRFVGTPGHTGALPQDQRQDALYAATDFMQFLKKLEEKYGAHISIQNLSTLDNSPTSVPPVFELGNVEIITNDRADADEIHREILSFCENLQGIGRINSFALPEPDHREISAQEHTLSLSWHEVSEFCSLWQIQKEELRFQGHDLVHTIPVLKTDEKGGTLALETRSVENGLLQNIKNIVGNLMEKFPGLFSSNGNFSASKASEMDPRLTEALRKTGAEKGLPVLEMASGATHDISVLADTGKIPCGFVFIRQEKGESHVPHEARKLDDMLKAVGVLADAIKELDKTLPARKVQNNFQKELKNRGALQYA